MNPPIWRIFLLFAYGYVLSFALRVVNAIIGPPMMAELGLSNADLGLISAAYFITFACLQLPLGIWLDRYGPRKTESILLLFAAFGCMLFATSQSFWSLWIARALIGVGVSACLMASLKAYRQWLPSDKQSQLANSMFVAGSIGALSATIPVVTIMPLVGWRGIFWIFAGLILIASALLFIFLKPIERAHQNASSGSLAAADPGGYRRIFTDPYFRRIGMMGAVCQGFFLAIQSLWAGLWMSQVLGMNKSQSGDALFFINFSLLVSFLALSYLAPRFIVVDGASSMGKRKGKIKLSHAVALGLSGSLLFQLLIILLSGSWAWGLWLLFAICSTAGSLMQSHIGLTFPASLAGRVNTAYNLLLFVSAFVAQWGMGIAIDQIGLIGFATAPSMRLAFAIFWVVQVIVLWLFVRNKAQASHDDNMAVK